MSAQCPWLTHLSSFAACSLRLKLAALDNGGDCLHDVSVALSEDGKFVSIEATHRDGSDVFASFELPAATTEELFDHEFWRALFDPEADQEAKDKEGCCCCCRCR